MCRYCFLGSSSFVFHKPEERKDYSPCFNEEETKVECSQLFFFHIVNNRAGIQTRVSFL